MEGSPDPCKTVTLHTQSNHFMLKIWCCQTPGVDSSRGFNPAAVVTVCHGWLPLYFTWPLWDWGNIKVPESLSLELFHQMQLIPEAWITVKNI